MAEERKRWYHHRSPMFIGPIWFIGWLFTIGYANLVPWQILVGIVVWPYFLGRAVGG